MLSPSELQIPLGRGAKAEEAAAAVLFLISPMASYVTGHTLEVRAELLRQYKSPSKD